MRTATAANSFPHPQLTAEQKSTKEISRVELEWDQSRLPGMVVLEAAHVTDTVGMVVWMDGRMDGWMDGRTDYCVDVQAHVIITLFNLEAPSPRSCH